MRFAGIAINISISSTHLVHLSIGSIADHLDQLKDSGRILENDKTNISNQSTTVIGIEYSLEIVYQSSFTRSLWPSLPASIEECL